MSDYSPATHTPRESGEPFEAQLWGKKDIKMANANWSNAGKIYSPYVKPVLLTCNFIVDSTNGNGLGIRSLKGPGIANVFGNTSGTPGRGTNGYLNPDPNNGTFLVQLQGNYQRYLAGFAGAIAPLSGSSVTTVTTGNPYVIVSLGTATLAQWQAKGLPVGITPAVGVAFVANASGTIGGSAAVQAPLSTGSGVDHFEVIGDPNLTLGGQAPSGPTGAFIVVQSFLSNVLTQPTNGSIIGLSFWMSDSSVTVNGQ
jgi:hypothetical protein